MWLFIPSVRNKGYYEERLISAVASKGNPKLSSDPTRAEVGANGFTFSEENRKQGTHTKPDLNLSTQDLLSFREAFGTLLATYDMGEGLNQYTAILDSMDPRSEFDITL